MSTIEVNKILIEYMHYDGQNWQAIIDAFGITYFSVEPHFSGDQPYGEHILYIRKVGDLINGTTLVRWHGGMMVMDTDFFNNVIIAANQ